MSTSGKVYFSSFRTIGKSDFSESAHFHGFAFSDRGEDVFDLRKNYSFGKPIPKKYFPSGRQGVQVEIHHSHNHFVLAPPDA